jgi:hypothetical protein
MERFGKNIFIDRHSQTRTSRAISQEIDEEEGSTRQFADSSFATIRPIDARCAATISLAVLFSHWNAFFRQNFFGAGSFASLQLV